jgi:hypothetical protein
MVMGLVGADGGLSGALPCSVWSRAMNLDGRRSDQGT